jgi:HSP20 family protein
MPMPPSRETSEREGVGGQRETGTSVGRRASQGTPVYGGYGYGGIASPFLAIRRFMEDMDRLASDFGFGSSLLSPSFFGQESGTQGLQQQEGRGSGLQTFWNPQVDVFQRGDQIVVRADLPGLKKEDVSIEIDQNTLTIRGERRQELEDRNEGFYRSERSYGTFQRSIALPEGVTPDDAQASFNDGVLEITVKTPRSQQRSKKIQIR